MTGELWRSQLQVGVEVTPGVGVAATRKLYAGPDSVLSRTRAPRPHRFATGTRDNVRAMTLGPIEAGGRLTMPMSASEILELLLLGLKGGVTPTTPGGGTITRLWTFTPSTTLDSATLEWDDGATAWRELGVRVNQLTIEGSADGENTVTAELFGTDLAANALTGSLASRVPDFLEGWQTKLYADAYGGTAGSTNIAGTLLRWRVTISNNLGRKYFADGTQAAGAVPFGEIGISAELDFEGSAAQSATEFTNWNAVTKRLIRLEFKDATAAIEGTLYKFVTVDIPGAWDAYSLGESDKGTRVYRLGLAYVYDTTNAYGVQIRAQNTRTAAW